MRPVRKSIGAGGERGDLEVQDVAGKNLAVGIGGVDVGEGGVLLEVGEGLVAFDEVAVEVVALWALISCDRGLVCVSQKVGHGTEVAFVVGVLCCDGDCGEKSDLAIRAGRGITAGEVGNKVGRVCGGEEVPQVSGHDLNGRAGFAVGFGTVFCRSPECRRAVNDIEKND